MQNLGLKEEDAQNGIMIFNTIPGTPDNWNSLSRRVSVQGYGRGHA